MTHPPLVELDLGGERLRLWPYTARRPSLDAPSDPINLVFTGPADVRDVRAALLAVEPRRDDRYPSTPPFDGRWRDAMGVVQATFTAPDGWIGSAVQLELGDYESVRFHVRLFQAGDRVLGNAHLDVLIPGTAEHEAVAWREAAELVTGDLRRSGLLAAPVVESPVLGDTRRTVPRALLESVPEGVRSILPHPGPGDVVDVPDDGRALIVEMAAVPDRRPGAASRVLVMPLDQVIPRPFCGSPGQLLRVRGPVVLEQWVDLTAGGDFTYDFRARGTPELTLLEEATGTPVGAPYRARVDQHYRGGVTGGGSFVTSVRFQMELPPGRESPPRHVEAMRVGGGHSPIYSVEEEC